MTIDPMWAFGLFFSALMTIMGGIIGYQMKQISDLRADIGSVRSDYVRRDDAAGSIGRVEKSLDEVREDVKEVSGMVVKVLLALGKPIS